jgi:putative hydrolase of the HAD superfamily
MPFSIDDSRLAVVLDLDDTLYLERDYVCSGLRAAGDWLRLRRGISGLERISVSLFEEGVRGRLFDTALQYLDIDASPSLIARLVFEYRRHLPAIGLAPDAARYLNRTANQLAIVTDGSALAQRMKVSALGLRDLSIKPIIYTDDLGQRFRKPHVRAFELVRATLAANAFVYVADNLAKDFLGPRAIGWRTIQIERPERIHRGPAPSPMHRADLCISSFDDLAAALQRLAIAPAEVGLA